MRAKRKLIIVKKAQRIEVLNRDSAQSSNPRAELARIARELRIITEILVSIERKLSMKKMIALLIFSFFLTESTAFANDETLRITAGYTIHYTASTLLDKAGVHRWWRFLGATALTAAASLAHDQFVAGGINKKHQESVLYGVLGSTILTVTIPVVFPNL